MFRNINGGNLPQRATIHSAGFDVFANEDMVIGAGETKIIPLGICLDQAFIDQAPDLYAISSYLELHPRSSLRAKGLGGGVGIIDMDYQDEIMMVITNHLTYESFNNGSYFEIKRGDKIGQLIVKSHLGYMVPSVYTKDDRRIGGFGSTNYAI